MWRIRGLVLAMAVVVALGVASTATGRGGRETDRVIVGDGVGAAGGAGPVVGRRWE